MSNLPEYTETLIQKLSGLLGAFRQQSTNAELQTILSRWELQFEQMRSYARAHDRISIAFVGGTGAGKSTLINALLDADLLPTHSFKTCTSAAIEVSYAPRKTWRAELSYLPLTAWEKEKKQFLDEVKEAQESGHSSFTYQDFLYKAWTLYRPRTGQPPMPFPLDDLIKLLQEPLPMTLQKQIQAGTYQLKAKTPAELKIKLNQFLTADSPIWPLLQQVKIQGPAEILKDGLHLIDLPGLNDPNPIREQITHKYLQEAEFIWLIFGTGRGLTRELIEVMKAPSFISQIVLDGKVSALSFIGTRTDDFVPSLEQSSLGLVENCSSEDIRQAREKHIRQQILQQLSELTLWFANRYKVSEQSQDVLKLIAETLLQSPVYLTSALNYLALRDWFPLDNLRFSKPEQTGLPQTRAFMQKIVSEHGITARKKLIRSQFQQINSEVRRLIESMKYRQSLSHLNQKKTLEFQIKIQKIRQDHLRLLRDTREKLQQDLNLKRIQFEKQMLYSFGDLHHRSDQLISQWHNLNWQYLVKAVQDKGRYTSPSTGTSIDLIRDLLQHIETELALDWYAFFQHHLIAEVDQGRFLISGLLEQTSQSISDIFSQHDDQWIKQTDEISKQGQSIIDETSFRLRYNIESQIKKLQKLLPALLEEILKKAFQPVFKEATEFKGKGRKQEIINHLEISLKKLLPQISTELQEPLHNKLLEVVQLIQKHHDELRICFHDNLNYLSQDPRGGDEGGSKK